MIFRLPGRLILGSAAGGALVLSVAACGGSGGSSANPAAGGSAAPAAAATASATQSAASAAGNPAHAGSIDVCSLLSPAGAGAVAKQFKLASDPSATYKLMTVKQPPPTTAYPTSACQFTIAQVTSDNTGSEAIVTVTVQPAKYLDRTGTKVPGLGDEAYDEGEYVEVRVGDVVLQSNNSQGASKDFINGLYRAMIPNVKLAAALKLAPAQVPTYLSTASTRR
ncbi:MAG TPA: hypothetical protein VGI00_20985 [Streptosporangiaceae bacterium]